MKFFTEQDVIHAMEAMIGQEIFYGETLEKTLEMRKNFIQNYLKFLKPKFDFEWYSVDIILPETHNQHGSYYGSGYLLTYDKLGNWDINQYWRSSSEWGEGAWEIDNELVTHWSFLIKP